MKRISEILKIILNMQYLKLKLKIRRDKGNIVS